MKFIYFGMHDDACFLQDSLAFHKCGQDWPSISECHHEKIPGQPTLPQTVFNGICDRVRNDSWQLRLHGVKLPLQASDSIQQIGQMEHLCHKIFLKKKYQRLSSGRKMFIASLTPFMSFFMWDTSGILREDGSTS